MTQTILVTGGCGYIGSHTVVALLEASYNVVILDNLCNSSAHVVARIDAIAGRKPQTITNGDTAAKRASLTFVNGDVRDKNSSNANSMQTLLPACCISLA